MTPNPTLIAFGGLPGSGKTTLARALAGRLAYVYLRIDTIEQALLPGEVGPFGYLVAYALAADNLRIGNGVVADSVNPLQETRASWAEVAEQSAVPLIEVEIICSDKSEHRQRVEQRLADIAGHQLPTWEAVQHRQYEEWSGPHILLDTAGKSIGQSLDELATALAQHPLKVE